MIFHLGLFELQLHQLVDLEDLTERDEEAVLLHLAVAQNDLAMTRERSKDVKTSVTTCERARFPVPISSAQRHRTPA